MFISFTNIHTTFQNVIQSKKKAVESFVAPPGAVGYIRYKIDSTQGYKPAAAAVCVVRLANVNLITDGEFYSVHFWKYAVVQSHSIDLIFLAFLQGFF